MKRHTVSRALGARRLLPALVAAALAGCASLADDAGLGAVEQASGHELKASRTAEDAQAIDRRVGEMLARPLTADAAVQVALLNNRGLQAAFAELGVADAERVQASRLPNPGFSVGRLRRGEEVEIERGVHLDLARLLTLPLVRRLEGQRFERAQRETALQVLSLAAATRRAYYEAVAADERLRYALQVRDAAEAGAELARRMAQVGNFNALQRAREQAFYADAALGAARAQQARGAARERLVRHLGLWGEPAASLNLPDRLPELPAQPQERPDIERVAMAQRLDVQAARLGVEQTARNLGLGRATRFVDVLELGAVRNSSNEAPTQRGWEVTLELPLFDWGDARVARAEAVYMQALHRAAETAVEARSQVREAYAAYRGAWDIARHQRDEVLPLRKRIADENLLRYNGMLIGVFELLADARAQVASVDAYIGSLRDFWIAEADLEMALVGPPSLSPSTSPAAAAAEPAGGH
jgi:outer membrane protein TolC